MRLQDEEAAVGRERGRVVGVGRSTCDDGPGRLLWEVEVEVEVECAG